MHILIVTSCTGQKAVTSPRALTGNDFAQGTDHVRAREQELNDLRTPARDLYSGQQHVRLMRGIGTVQERLDVDLHVLSAGYGLVPGDRKLAPYESSFTGRGKRDLKDWAARLRIPDDFRVLVAKPYDLGLLLLGDQYLSACDLDANVALAGPTIALCSRNIAKRLPDIEGFRTVGLSHPEAKRFSCGLVALKGEICARLLQFLAKSPTCVSKLTDPTTNVLALVDSSP